MKIQEGSAAQLPFSISNSASNSLSLTVHDVAFGGSGVARHEGKVFFVPFTIPGEQVKARITRAKKKFAEAELVAVEQPSPERVEPKCPVFGRCGGCAYQHMAYSAQLRIKQAQVEQTLRRVGKLEHVPMRPIVAAPEEYGYRNRIRVHAEGGVIGFYGRESHVLVDVPVCPISTDAVNQGLAEIRRSAVPDGDYVLSGREGGAYFEQTNDAVAQLLLQTATELIRPGQEMLVDAYCGAGLFAHHLAPKFKTVVGIEENEFAVDRARRRANGNERYIAGDVQQHLADVLAGPPEKTTVILDPPAAGVSPRVLDLLLGARPGEIVYVSCDPATLARDLGALVKGGYRLESVTPLDMFPQTAEIEVITHLVRG